jgi:hypothetical protein
MPGPFAGSGVMGVGPGESLVSAKITRVARLSEIIRQRGLQRGKLLVIWLSKIPPNKRAARGPA